MSQVSDVLCINFTKEAKQKEINDFLHAFGIVSSLTTSFI